MARLVSRKLTGFGKARFSGKYGGPCKRGHDEGRYDSGACKVCVRERSAARNERTKQARANMTPRQKAKREEVKKREAKAAAKAFHEQWLAERRARKANDKLVLELLK